MPSTPTAALNAPESRWPAVMAVLAAGALYTVLPGSLAVGPRGLVPGLAGGLALLSLVAHRRGYFWLNIILGHLISGILTAFMLWSLALLIRALPAHTQTPVALLRSAATLWAVNVLVFALWYWRLDAGGPHARDGRTKHETGAFLFPQMTLDGPAGQEPDGSPWSPRFIDYLFLAFNTSTAFSPTDVPVLGRWAKVLVMIQAGISLAVVALLAARAVNVL